MTLRYPDPDDPAEWEWDTPTRLDDVIFAFRHADAVQQEQDRVEDRWERVRP